MVKVVNYCDAFPECYVQKWKPACVCHFSTLKGRLSRGRVIHRVLELREEITTFLDEEKTAEEEKLHGKMKDEGLLLKVGYFADFLAEVNFWNFSPQGNEVNVLPSRDKVAVFHRKVQLSQHRVQTGGASVFSELTTCYYEDGKRMNFL